MQFPSFKFQPPKSCMHFSLLPFLPHAQPISYFIWSPSWRFTQFMVVPDNIIKCPGAPRCWKCRTTPAVSTSNHFTCTAPTELNSRMPEPSVSSMLCKLRGRYELRHVLLCSPLLSSKQCSKLLLQPPLAGSHLCGSKEAERQLTTRWKARLNTTQGTQTRRGTLRKRKSLRLSSSADRTRSHSTLRCHSPLVTFFVWLRRYLFPKIQLHNEH
jgi:hypothetical protein